MSGSSSTKYRKMIVAAGALAAVALGVLFAFGLPATGIEAAEQPASPPAIPVEVATVTQRDVTTWDELSGRLEAVERVEVRSRVAGAVQSIHFIEGALVKRGDLLVRIDPDPYAAAVERAQAQVVAAQARLEYTRSEHQRARRLWDAAAIAQRELDERANAEREADANLRAAQAALQSARLDLGYTEVRAPVAGRVGKLEITVGNLVAAGPGAPVLTTLVSVDPMYASFDAGETIIARALKDSPRIKNIPVEMETVTNGGTRKRGHLQLVDNQVNPRTGTVRVRAVFDNHDGGLMAGQFVKLRMGRAKTQSAILVAERAVGTDQSKRFVMVVGADDKAAYREVTLGTSVDGQRIVISGLEPGERIVVNGLQRVRPGALLSPQPAAASAASSTGAS